MNAALRQGLLAELGRVAVADKPDVVLHALEVGCGAAAVEATQAEVDDVVKAARKPACVCSVIVAFVDDAVAAHRARFVDAGPSVAPALAEEPPRFRVVDQKGRVYGEFADIVSALRRARRCKPGVLVFRIADLAQMSVGMSPLDMKALAKWAGRTKGRHA